MKDLKEQLIKLKPWIILSTYIFMLILVIIKMDNIAYVFTRLTNLLRPLFYAIGIAYVLNIPMTKIENLIHNKVSSKNIIYKNSRGIAVFLSILLAISILVFLVLFITPQLVTSIASLINNIALFLEGLSHNINEILVFFNLDSQLINLNVDDFNKFINSLGINWESILLTAKEIMTNVSFNIVDFTVGFAQSLTTWFIGFLLSIYLMSSKESLIRQSRKLILFIIDVELSKKVFGVLTKTNKIFKLFIGGQLLEAIIIGALIYIMMILTNMPYSLLISMIVAVMALVPVFGAMFAMAVGFILILSVNILQAISFVVLFQLIQLFENNVIYPRVVGNSVGLPAIWTLLSIMVFGGLLGVLGMLLAVPLTASIYSLLSSLINKKFEDEAIVSIL